jgi:hypothetical protein
MRITESYLRKIIKEELNEMDLTTVGLGMLGGIAGVGLFFGVKVLGQATLEKFAEGYVAYEHLKKQIEQKKAEKILTDQAADAAIKVVEVLNKHMDNQELIDLVKNRKLKEFAAKLEELEGGDVDSSSVYKKFKSRLGMPKNDPTKRR